MSVPAFTNGGMNVTGLRLVDFTDPAVKAYLKGWSVVNRDVKVLGGASHNKIIEVCLAAVSPRLSDICRIIHCYLRAIASVCTCFQYRQ